MKHQTTPEVFLTDLSALIAAPLQVPTMCNWPGELWEAPQGSIRTETAASGRSCAVSGGVMLTGNQEQGVEM